MNTLNNTENWKEDEFDNEEEYDEDGQDELGEDGQSDYDPKLQKTIRRQSRLKDKDKYINHMDVDNPYRKQSSLDLSQTIKSYRMIEKTLLLELIKSKIPSSEWSIFMYILHRTRGYRNKKGFDRQLDSIPIKMFEKSTGLHKKTIYKSIQSLIDKHMIYCVINETVKGTTIFHGINYRYDTWILKHTHENIELQS